MTNVHLRVEDELSGHGDEHMAAGVVIHNVVVKNMPEEKVCMHVVILSVNISV